jgi:two-component system, NtrC family, response regulator HydG
VKQQLDILIVDDDRDNALSLGDLFELEGHKIVLARDGEEAIAQFLSRDFDIAFMDVVMPGKNGVETFLEIKRLKPAARVVMMTGYSVEQLLVQALEHGALAVLTKPLNSSEIVSIVDEVGPDGVMLAPSLDGSEAGVLSSALGSAGRRCHIINSQNQTINAVDIQAGDVLIHDHKRTLIEELGSCRDLRQSGITATSIVLAQTFGAGEDAGELLRDTRATGILNKPFEPEKLLENLHALASGKT